MESTLFYGVTYEACTQCKGHWFDSGELQQLEAQGEPIVDQVDADAPAATGIATPSSAVRNIPCPTCCTPLKPYQFQQNIQVELDVCPTCNGIWVRHGDLKLMAQSMAPQQPAPAPSPTATPQPASQPQAQPQPPVPGPGYQRLDAPPPIPQANPAAGGAMYPYGSQMPANLAQPQTSAEIAAASMVNELTFMTNLNRQTAMNMGLVGALLGRPAFGCGLFGGGWL